LLLLAACNGCHGSTQPAAVTSAPALGASATAVPSASANAAPTAAASPAPTVFRPPSTPGKRPVTKAEDCPKDMVFIPGGTFKYKGIVPGRKQPVVIEERWVTMPPYCIDQHEVDGKDYQACEKRNECEHPTSYNWLCIVGIGRAVGCTNYRQAGTFCRRGFPGVTKRLPTDEELMFAAKGTDGRKYPWGNDQYPRNEHGVPERLCFFPGQLTPDFQECRIFNTRNDLSPFGVWALGTNGSEWTSTPTCVGKPPKCVEAVVVRNAPWPLPLDEGSSQEEVADHPFLAGGLGPDLKFRCALSEL
jgi:formylglycine-generating enzyme required for sulfatase activity